MTSETNNATQASKHGLLRRHFYLTVGAILFIPGLTIALVAENILHHLESMCSFDTAGSVPSNLVCKVKDDFFGQDITFEASFYDTRTGSAIKFETYAEIVKFPANVQIIDPSGVVLRSENFNDKIAFSFKPSIPGDYKALITYLDNGDKTYDSAHTGISVQYGFVTGDNALNSELWAAMEIGGITSLVGFIFLVYGGIKHARS